MTASVRFRPLAEADLFSLAAFIADQGQHDASARFLAAAQETIALITTHLALGPKVKTPSAATLNGVRMFPVRGFPNYLIFYLLRERYIEVIRIIQGTVDQGALFRH